MKTAFPGYDLQRQVPSATILAEATCMGCQSDQTYRGMEVDLVSQSAEDLPR